MSEGKFVLPGAETISMSGDAARRLIGCGSGDAALLYLYILTSGGKYDRDEAAARMGRSQAQVDTAMAVLARLGLVSRGEDEEQPKVQERAEAVSYTHLDVYKRQ